MTRPILIVLASLIILALSFWGVGLVWADYGMTLSLHGWIAYGLGCAGSIALAAGLFWLTFKSAREGYDDIDPVEPFKE